MNQHSRPKNDGIIDEVAIARVFAGDTAVGARLTPDEREEVLRRATARIDRENAIIAHQRVPNLRSAGFNVTIGPEVIDKDWKALLSAGMGWKLGPPGDYGRYNIMHKAIGRHRARAAAWVAA